MIRALMIARNNEELNSVLCAKSRQSFAAFENRSSSTCSLANEHINFIAYRLSSTKPPRTLTFETFAKAYLFIWIPKTNMNRNTTGKYARHINVNRGPLKNAIAIPARRQVTTYMIFPNFSPMDSVMVAKFSPIWEGSCSTF
jgi:hypothetical protein